MLLAIDVGNTHAVFGLWDGSAWRAIWRRHTDPAETEDQLAVWLKGVHELSGLALRVNAVVIASVVPQMDTNLKLLAEKWLDARPVFLRDGGGVGLTVDYEPPTAVGADRIANALGALARFKPPIIVVDFGTATTFDSIDRNGAYVGGAILPGVVVSSQALVEHAAKLPQIDLVAPPTAVGKNTVHSLQSGVMLGYAGAIDALSERIDQELGGGATIVSTGGLGNAFAGLCKSISEHDETLTLDGLVIAYERLKDS
ncbi:MAG TPA: type III pantothenate kinase [Fimbriimonadaceae bacterium]|nr:type III pantothenate kinase [Fimbriimonadaceae bacterium]